MAASASRRRGHRCRWKAPLLLLLLGVLQADHEALVQPGLVVAEPRRRLGVGEDLAGEADLEELRPARGGRGGVEVKRGRERKQY